MFAILNLGFTFKKAKIGFIKEKIPPKKGNHKNHY